MLSNLPDLDAPSIKILKVSDAENGVQWVEYECGGQFWAHTFTPQWLASKNSPQWVALREALATYNEPSDSQDDDVSS